MTKMGDPAQFQGRIIFMSMFNDISWRSEDNEQECIANATLDFICKKIYQDVAHHSQDLDQKREVVFYLH